MKFMKVSSHMTGTIITGMDLLSVTFQFVLLLLMTTMLMYSVISGSRERTIILSYKWLLIETTVATLMCFVYYLTTQIFDLHIALAILLVAFPLSNIVDITITYIDQGDLNIRYGKGKSLIDLDAKNRKFFQTDHRLVRRASTHAVFFLLMLHQAALNSP